MDPNYSPIQVVLDARGFQADRIRPPGGNNKEFFPENDAGFVAHRQFVQEELAAVGRRLVASGSDAIGFVRVQMREEALAKSHRPDKCLFPSSYAPTIGSGDIGEVIIQVSPSTIARAISEAGRAEDRVAMKPSPTKANPNRTEADPTRWRSEVGAIQSVQLWSEADRRSFSAKQAIEWFSNKAVPRAYRVDLFDGRRPDRKAAQAEFDAHWDFVANIRAAMDHQLTCGYVATLHKPDPEAMSRLYIWLVSDANARFLVPRRHVRQALNKAGELTLAANHHQVLLSVLDRQTAVRRVSLPASLESNATTHAGDAGTSTRHTYFEPLPDARYPVVGVIDGGVGQLPAPWRVHTANPVAAQDADPTHGGFIGALLVDGQRLNGADVCGEPDGCWVADLALIPRRASFSSYYDSEMDLVSQIEVEVREAKAKVGARIFSFSHNMEDPPGGNPTYTELSQGLDRISRENDVVFVVSAGNTRPGAGRQEWGSSPVHVLTDLATAQGDRITAPADSVLSVAVGALNPPTAGAVLSDAPARYSRRGPGYKQLVKPDVAHYGGACSSVAPDTGLKSVGRSGGLQNICGTSFSTPLVAKTLARYDQLTEGSLPREALIALLLHSARVPTCMAAYSRGQIVRNLVGFGKPASAKEMVDGSPHAATLLFHDRMMPAKDLYFSFDWPQSLTQDGKCRGEATLTLVYSPPVADAFESELVRVNLDATLQRRSPKTGKYEKVGEDTFVSDGAPSGGWKERELIDDGLKWGVVKQTRFFSPRGSGKSSDWRIWLKYLVRSGEAFPEPGVPFALILTIADPQQAQPVYQDMRIGLGMRNVLTSDITQPIPVRAQQRT